VCYCQVYIPVIVLEADSEQTGNQNCSPAFGLFCASFAYTLNRITVVLKGYLVMRATGNENPARNTFIVCRRLVTLGQSSEGNDRMFNKMFLFRSLKYNSVPNRRVEIFRQVRGRSARVDLEVVEFLIIGERAT